MDAVPEGINEHKTRRARRGRNYTGRKNLHSAVQAAWCTLRGGGNRRKFIFWKITELRRPSRGWKIGTAFALQKVHHPKQAELDTRQLCREYELAIRLRRCKEASYTPPVYSSKGFPAMGGAR